MTTAINRPGNSRSMCPTSSTSGSQKLRYGELIIRNCGGGRLAWWCRFDHVGVPVGFDGVLCVFGLIAREMRQMQSNDVRRKPHGKTQGLGGRSVPGAQRHHDDGGFFLADVERARLAKLSSQPPVVIVHELEQCQQQRHGQDRDPRTFDEFGNQDDRQRNGRGRGSHSVDGHPHANADAAEVLALLGSLRIARLRPRSQCLLPMHDHAGLREHEGREGADGK